MSGSRRPDLPSPAILAVLAALALAGVASAAPGALAGEAWSPPALELPAEVFDLHDPDGSARRAVGLDDAARNLRRLRERAPTGVDAEETVRLAVGMARSLDWGDVDPVDVGRWTMLAAAQVAIDRHPDAARALNDQIDRPSPIEEYCDCVGRGARACGCVLVWWGDGACEYSMECTWWEGFCNAVSIQACILRGGTDIVRPWK